MITNEIIEELYPTLDSLWEHNDRNRWNNRDIWQVPGKKSFKVVVNIINSLEFVSDMTLLDYGCDVGLHSIVASHKFKKVVAIDNDIVSYRRAKVTKEIFEKKGYNLSNLEIKNVDFAEVHDCFTIAEIMAIEDLGFFKKGEGGKASEQGKTAMDGEIPINPSGGLKAKGHPVGATGVAQAIEVTEQLRGNADKRQVKDAEIGLTHNVGGSGATVVVNLYKRA